ncbi:MAG TPA: hypothetical protein VMK12_28705 [Anaeromyxobacteraceae bacterium]|nr:hypothetical protein [Anaeromyxobacteraceae bacterium]
MLGKAPQLKPQDILVLLKLALGEGGGWSYPRIATELGMSASEVHAAMRRAVLAKLAVTRQPKGFRVQPQNLVEFLVHGVKYAFPAARGPVTRGHPTAYAAPVLRKRIVEGEGLPPVWPDPEGPVRGELFSPLYPSQAVIKAILADPSMYDATALVDAIRGGSARERQIAAELLEEIVTKRKR